MISLTLKHRAPLQNLIGDNRKGKIMKKIKISIDSASDISKEVADKYGINLIPINIMIEGKAYKDGVDIMPVEFFKNLPGYSEIPKTSQITVVEHMESFKKLVDEYDVIHISISGAASGTNQSAHLAANEIMDENPDADITIVDPSSFSYGYGLYAIQAAQMAQEGKGKEEILAFLEDRYSHCKILFGIDTLDYLQKGGRISSQAKIIANVLDINPILAIEGGLVVNKEKIRGKKKLPGKITDLVSEMISDDKEQTIAIMHANCPEKAEKIKELLIEKTGVSNYVIETLGPTIGGHTGPGAFGVIFRGK